MDALGLQAARGRRFQDALDECGDAERYTLGLRLRWFPWLEIGFFLPIATAVLWGGWLAWNGHITHRGRHRRDALRAAAARPARRADLVARRDPVRRDLAGPHPRGLGGAARPGRHRGAARRRAGRRRRRALLLPRGPRRAARRLARAGARRAARHRRAVRRRQVDPGPADGRHRRAAHRPGDRSAACPSSTSRCPCCAARWPW